MSNDFASLAEVQLPVPCRLLASACCPDKDLLILITRLGGHDRISLWKMQGSKTWEVDVSTDSERIVGVAWSPDGQTVAIAHDPPSISLHSIQDGQSERVISIPPSDVPISQLTSIWWFHQEKPEKSPIPDIFKRGGVITGSAHSILRTLPLLDPLRDDSQQLTATDLFAFQGSQTTARRVKDVPDVIKWWPTLQPDPVFASINVPNATRTVENGIVDEVDDANLNSILAVADCAGHLACFLDGTYPLGSIQLGSSNTTVASLFKDPKRPVFLAHPVNDGSFTDLLPTHIFLSVLEERKVRDFAKLSTTARELCWYIQRVIEEMHTAWFGSSITTGARELGPKWVRSYEIKQQEQYGLKPNAILDLTTLLLTDRPSEALADYLGSGQQMSERSLQKWDSAVTEALVKLRDYSEKRLVPACQRLHLVLGEVRGWSCLPTLNSTFEIPSETVAQCLTMVNQTVLLATWLAAAARREHNRFKEFMTWLRYETVILNPNPAPEAPPAPLRHDILEVNHYFMSGLEKSTIDKWFTDPIPTFTPEDLGVPGYDLSVSMALQKANEYLENPVQTATETQDRFNQKSLEDIDRNLEALIKSLVQSCREVFDRPSGATARSATISVGFGSTLLQGQPAISSSVSQNQFLTRDRTMVDKDGGQYVQFLVLHAPPTSEHRAFVTFVRQRYGHDNSHVEVALHECCVGGEMSEHVVDLLALEFFDDETVVMVYRTGEEGQACIATLSYGDLGYQQFQPPEGYVTKSRESLIESAFQGSGQIKSGYLPIKQSRALKGCKSGAVSLAVNGRVGRRVACVLDNKGTMLETFDLEGDEVEEGDTTLD